MDLVETYMRLALALDLHIPGYLDSYSGPPEWKEDVVAAGTVLLPELSAQVNQLASSLDQDVILDSQRREFLALQVRSMKTHLRMLQGERLTLFEETEGIYDVHPEWVSEELFNEAHQVLDELLPSGNNLVERLAVYKKSYEVRLAPESACIDAIAQELRRRTKSLFGLPPGERFELRFVSGQPWSAYNWFLGQLHSRIEINTDVPTTVLGIAGLLAHEGYPGHHTELSSKEYHLALKRGWVEHQMQVLYGPSAVISEAIATRALETLIPQDELEDWYDQEIFPMAGLGHQKAGRALEIEKARRQLSGVVGNAVFLMHDRHAPESEVLAYVQHYHPGSDKETANLVRFIQAYRAYAFTYYCGGELLDRLFAAQGNRQTWFRRLLKEPVIPGHVKAWTQNVTQ
jgi:hypothetical protein